MTIEDAIRVLQDRECCRECVHTAFEIDGCKHGCDECDKAFEMAYAALRAQQKAEAREAPLTLDELREMDGEPVWCIDGGGCERWGLVNADVIIEVIGSDSEALEGVFYNMMGDGNIGLHPLGWIAYRHKPSKEN